MYLIIINPGPLRVRRNCYRGEHKIRQKPYSWDKQDGYIAVSSSLPDPPSQHVPSFSSLALLLLQLLAPSPCTPSLRLYRNISIYPTSVPASSTSNLYIQPLLQEPQLCSVHHTYLRNLLVSCLLFHDNKPSTTYSSLNATKH